MEAFYSLQNLSQMAVKHLQSTEHKDIWNYT